MNCRAIASVSAALLAIGFVALIVVGSFKMAQQEEAAWLIIKIKWEDAKLVRICPQSNYIYRLKDGEYWTGDREGHRHWSRPVELKVC